jgi:LacI family transcriptional regulator
MTLRPPSRRPRSSASLNARAAARAIAPASGMRSTLSMVAERAGVSPSTVSRVLNGTARVSPDKLAQVQAAIEALGFRPDHAARALASGRTMSIGVLTQYIDSPYYGEALRGIEHELQRAGYAPLFVSGHWNEAEELSRLQLLEDRKVDGLIILTGRLTDATLVDMARRLPVVVTGRSLSAPNLFSIDFDNAEAMGLAVRHLHAQGHLRVAYICGPIEQPDAAQRLAGYQAELQRREMAQDPSLIVHGDFQEAGGFRAMNQLLESRATFTAVIAANDQMAYGARLALYRAGLRVPDDISLIGFDDLPHSAFTLPPLTSIRQSVYDMGTRAALAMLDLLASRAPTARSLPAELIVRESTRLFRR